MPDRRPGRGADPRRGGRARLGTINYEVTCGAAARGCAGTSAREPLEERLWQEEPVRPCARALGEPSDVWIVGGTLRDALIGRPVARRGPRRVRRSGADRPRRAGGGRRRRVPAVGGVRRVAGRGPRPELGRATCRRCRAPRSRRTSRERDFTVNAMALPLAGRRAARPPRRAGRPRRGHPAGARGSDSAYAADPLRPLRLARLATELGWRPTPRPSA